MPRQCIFCGGAPVTLEHVWPEWLLPRFETAGGAIERTGTTTTITYSSRSIEITARCVCRPCNGGWMSDLENDAKQYLAGMLDGRSTVLDSAAQRKLASWATKTAMVFEYTLGLAPNEIYWRQEEREAFRILPHIPPGVPAEDTDIRVATFGGSRVFLARSGAHMISPRDTPDVAVPAIRATLQVGRVVLQVESHRWREVIGRGLWRIGTGLGTVLWPELQQEIPWPIEPPLDDDQLVAFAAY